MAIVYSERKKRRFYSECDGPAELPLKQYFQKNPVFSNLVSTIENLIAFVKAMEVDY